MRHFSFVRCMCFVSLTIAGTALHAQTDPFDTDVLPKPDDTTVPLDDKVDLGKPKRDDSKPPEGLFTDGTRKQDENKAPKDGGAETLDIIGSTRSAQRDYRRGQQLMDEGDWRDAIEYLDDAIQADPKMIDALLARATARTKFAGEQADDSERSKMLDGAIADCNAALKLKPRSKEAYLARGIAQRLQNGYKQANVSFTSAIEIDQKFTEALLRRGIVLFYLNKDEIAPAVFDFDNVIRQDPRDYRAHLWRGLLYSRNGEYDQAIASFDQALDVKPDYAAALSNRGLAYLAQSKFEDALADFSELTQVAAGDKTAFFKRGVVQSELERYDDAVVSFGEAIDIDPEYADAFYNRSIAYANIDEFDKSSADYKEAVRLNPDLRD